MEISTVSEWAAIYLMSASHFVLLGVALVARRTIKSVWSTLFLASSLMVIALGFFARRLNHHLMESIQMAVPVSSWVSFVNANIGLATAGVFLLSTIFLLGIFLVKTK